MKLRDWDGYCRQRYRRSLFGEILFDDGIAVQRAFETDDAYVLLRDRGTRMVEQALVSLKALVLGYPPDAARLVDDAVFAADDKLYGRVVDWAVDVAVADGPLL